MSKAENAVLNFPEKFYVGVEGRKPFSTEDYPLAFATPWGTDAAFRKRKETVDNWVGERITRQYQHNPDYDKSKPEDESNSRWIVTEVDHGEYNPEVIDNVPLTGFSIDRVVERYRTDNKLYRINDPRGFQLEISADNLADLLINGSMTKGVFSEPLIWAKNGAKVFLCRTDHPSYLQHLAPKVSRSEGLKPGDVVRLGHDKARYVFVGVFYLFRFGTTFRYVNKTTQNIQSADFRPSYYNWMNDDNHHSKFEHREFSQASRDLKPWHVYQPLDNNYYQYYIARKPKKSEVIEEGHEFTPFTEASEVEANDYGYSYCIPFQSKAELAAFEINGDKVKELINHFLGNPRHSWRDARTFNGDYLGEL